MNDEPEVTTDAPKSAAMLVLEEKLAKCDAEIARFREARKVIVAAMAKQARIDRKQRELDEAVGTL